MAKDLYILYASQTGTAEDLAYQFNDWAKNKNFNTNLLELDDVSMDKLKDIQNLVVITSTTGDGEIPDNGKTFWENLIKLEDQNFNSLRYGVLALGDSSHYDFCNAGKIIDEKLKQLGAVCVIERLECDFDTEGSEEWSNKFFDKI